MTGGSRENHLGRRQGGIHVELSRADEARARGDEGTAWHHLERAHILSQPFAGWHFRVHLAMLTEGWRRGDGREVLGQIVRVLLAAPASWLGRAPAGNTGGANVGLFERLPVPADLRDLLEGR